MASDQGLQCCSCLIFLISAKRYLLGQQKGQLKTSYEAALKREERCWSRAWRAKPIIILAPLLRLFRVRLDPTQRVTLRLPSPTRLCDCCLVPPEASASSSTLLFPPSLCTEQTGVHLPGFGWGCLTQAPWTGLEGTRVWEWSKWLAKALFLPVKLTSEGQGQSGAV